MFAAVFGISVMISMVHGEPDSSVVEAERTTSKVAEKSADTTSVLNAPAQYVL